MSMILKEFQWKQICLLLASAALAGCVASNSVDSPSDSATPPTDAPGIDDAASEHDAVRYYIGKLPDRNYVGTYGDDENPRTWYTAAEELGMLGKPAIPALVERLDTPDPYELMLAVYALMLSSQDPELLAETDGDYLQLTTVLTPDTNEENRVRALDWWRRYQHLFP